MARKPQGSSKSSGEHVEPASVSCGTEKLYCSNRQDQALPA
ncbi:hypothetical protein [Vreelandella venusta]